MRLYADAVAAPNAGSERVKTRGRKRSGSLPFFGLADAMLTTGLRNGGRRLFQPTTDWSSRAEQSERPERDLWIAPLFIYESFFWNEI